MKKILVLAGSPRRGGNSDTLAEAFAEQAKKNGNQVDIVYITKHPVNGCLACDGCRNGKFPCVQKDGMQEIYPLLEKADAVVFATPLYYFGFPAQIKAVIDRLYAYSKPDKKALLHIAECAMIVCGESKDEDDYEGIIENYELTVDYLGWEDCGVLAATGLRNKEDARDSEWIEAAQDLAMNF